MSFLPYPPANATEAIAVFQQDVQIAHDIIHGDNTQQVDTEGGIVPTFAKVIKTLTDEVEAATGVDVSLRSDLANSLSSVKVANVDAVKVAAAGVVRISPVIATALGLKTAIESTLAVTNCVILTAGTYTASAEINIPAGKHLIVESGATINANVATSVFRINGSGSSITGGGKIKGQSSASVDPYTFAIATGAIVANCVVAGLTIEDFGNPIVFTDSVKCTVRDCTITGYRSMGIWFNSSVSNAFSTATQDAMVYNNRVSTTYGSYTSGVQAKGIYVSGVRPLVIGNEVDGGATVLSTGYGAGEQAGQRDGIWFNWCQDFICSGNKSRNSVDDCITVYRSVRGLISGNILTDSYITVGVLCIGGSAQYCEDIFIEGNKIFRNGYGGVAVLYGRNIYVSNNDIKDNGATGYLTVNAIAGFGVLSEIGESVVINGNTITKNKRFGVYGKTVNLGGGTIANNSGMVVSGGFIEGHSKNILIQGDAATKHNAVIIDNVTSRNATEYNAFLENVKRVDVVGGSFGSVSAFLAGNQYGIYASGVLDFNVNGSRIAWTTNSAIYCKPFTTTPAGEKLNCSISNVSVERVGDGIANANAAAVDANVDVLSIRSLAIDYADKRGVLFTPRSTSATVNVSDIHGYRIGAFNVNYGRLFEVASACANVHAHNLSVLCDQVHPNAPRALYNVVTPNGCTAVMLMNIDAARASSGNSIGTATYLKQVNVITGYA